MNCAICGAAVDRAHTHCAVCGHAATPDSRKQWDRAPEAALYQDLQTALEADETLLGATRGRATGNWRARMAPNARALFTTYINVGLTGKRLLIQPIMTGDGRAVSGAPGAIPITDVCSMTLSDVDAMEPGRTMRLVVKLRTGDSFRLRAAGRLAEGARNMLEVWRSLADGARTERSAGMSCPHCKRELDRPYRFCPFCGKSQEAR